MWDRYGIKNTQLNTFAWPPRDIENRVSASVEGGQWFFTRARER